MQVKNTLIKLIVAAVAMVPTAVAAQTSSINAFSPYTMYGIGEQNTPGTLPMRSMGGVGVAMRSSGVVNLRIIRDIIFVSFVFPFNRSNVVFMVFLHMTH